MKSEDIVESINRYLAIIKEPDKLLKYFNQGNYFYYNYNEVANKHSHIHAYPGIYEDHLYFFMVPAQYDNKESLDILGEHTQCCPVEGGKSGGGDAPGSHRIPDNIALERIIAWENNYQEWIPLQVRSEYGMFKAFTISTQDFESNDDAVFLALKEGLGAVSGFIADLIVANADKTAQVMVFDDFIRSVPPFPATAVEEKFYLLKI